MLNSLSLPKGVTLPFDEKEAMSTGAYQNDLRNVCSEKTGKARHAMKHPANIYHRRPAPRIPNADTQDFRTIEMRTLNCMETDYYLFMQETHQPWQAKGALPYSREICVDTNIERLCKMMTAHFQCT